MVTRAVRQSFPMQEEAVVTPGTAQQKADFVSPSALKIFSQNKASGCFGKANAKEVAQTIASNLAANELIERVDVASNGFLNITITNQWLESNITTVGRLETVEVQKPPRQRILVDFSSPNIAKEMHVGHLRSTIIGDSDCRCFEYLGHDVRRVNHLGDWGTQFGMLLSFMLEEYPDYQTNPPDISDLESFYKRAKKRFDEDPAFKEKSRLRVVELQAGSPQALEIWGYICKVSKDYLQVIYRRLGIVIEDVGESFYNSMLSGLVTDLRARGLVVESEGALIFPLPGQPVPLMVQKTDGGYGYDSTDLAAVRYRLLDLQMERCVYVTDSGQLPHFQQVFEAATICGWHHPPTTRLDHGGFGVVLGSDGKRFKTRSGDAVKLIALLDEAKARALEQLKKRSEDPAAGHNTHLSGEAFEAASELIGIAAIKYYDLKQNRVSTYSFDFDKMLDPKGNTAVYLIYAYARICSILEKAGAEALTTAKATEFRVTQPSERALALLINRFPDVLDMAVEELAVHRLCDLLYEVSVKYSEFYNNCRVLGAEEQSSRLLLCISTKAMMKQLFTLLGITPLEKI